MTKQSIKWRGIRLAVEICAATLFAVIPAMAQTAKVAASSVEITADPEKKKLAVGFRLVDAVDVTSVNAVAEGVAEPLPTTWEAWAGDKARPCAWLVVVDTSNPARAKTIESGKEAVRTFLTGLPNTDAVAVFGLARDLEQVAPFGGKPDDTLAAVATLKADGDASRTTLIYQNLREALPKLTARDEPRKAILLITDGIDETPGGAEAREIEKSKLIAAAKEAGVVVHCLGYAERLEGQSYFGALKDIALQTEGLFFPASIGERKLPDGTQAQLRGVMHGAGVAHVDVSKLEKGAIITVTANTAGGGEAVVKVPAEKVAEALPPKVVEPAPGEPKAKTPEELEAEKKAVEEEAKKKAKEEEEKVAAAKKAEDEKKKSEAVKKAAEEKKRLLMIIGAAVLLMLIIAALLMVRASRKRAAEEEARLALAARLAEEDRLAEQTLRAAEVTKKAEAPPLAWLEMCDAQQTRQPVRISSLKIGRGQHNDFVLRNDSVSGNHCVLNRTREGQWSVTDLSSGNGVALNGERVQQAELRHGDTIELGELKMRFLLQA
jgi:Skp family chaperone for outer membrane proteins